MAKAEKVTKKWASCPGAARTIQVDNTYIGYGCTRDAAADDFFDRVLDAINAEAGCEGKDCKTGVCAPELIDNPMPILDQLQYRRVRIRACTGAGWKCFLFAENQTQNQNFSGRCTCVPQTV